MRRELLNPKKMIGFLGRKYGGKPFKYLRWVYYATGSLVIQLYEISYILRGRYAPTHPDHDFHRKFYLENKDNVASEEVSGIICMCDGRMYHGGPTDRLRGILSTYSEAKKKGVPFYINWTNPFSLTDFLIPATFDWQIKNENICYDAKKSFPLIIDDESNFESLLRMKVGLRMKKLRQIHVYSNADNSIGNYRLLYHELFKPSASLAKEVSKHAANLGKDFEAFTFRFLHLLGDFTEWSQELLSDEEAENFMERNFQEFQKLTIDIPLNQKILVTSDSFRFLNYISAKDPRVYVVPGEVKNIDLTKGTYNEAWMKTFVDQQLLMLAKKVTLMRTGPMYNSGFPRFAAEIGGKEFINHQF